jgi:Protein of unknown function (DUF3048) N-terminal domain/Protein of unknown function (DUF3048) C-terminal domain
VALTQRGKVVIGVVAAAVVAVLAILAFTGNAPAPLQRLVETVTGPDPCPLTGAEKKNGDDAPARPMIAVKVENSDLAYPLAGLERADVIYEEPVEGGITRFAALYHCAAPARVGPVRSARTTDPKILAPYADAPVLAYSGANPTVASIVDAAGIISLTETSANAAYVRDDGRSAPHDLFVSVQDLYPIAAQQGAGDEPPRSVFSFDEEVPTPNRPRTGATVTFSSSTVVGWSWTNGRWHRLLDGAPMTAESGAPIAVDNVVIQQVLVTDSDIVDVAGFPSPEVKMVGRGRAWVLRDGRLIVGRWRRASLDEATIFETRAGDEIALAPGTTFVQLIPRDGGDVAFQR